MPRPIVPSPPGLPSIAHCCRTVAFSPSHRQLSQVDVTSYRADFFNSITTLRVL